MQTFPTVKGTNLERKEYQLPKDFKGELNLVLVAFQRWHQTLVDTWIPFARQLEQEHPGVLYYELPTIYKMNILSRMFINEGMRAGIPDPLSRERTITLYLDRPAFLEALDLTDVEEIYILLVDRAGRVYWRAEGAFNREKGIGLLETLHAHAPQAG